MDRPMRDVAQAVSISLDQNHWIDLAWALRNPKEKPVYARILTLATELRAAGKARFPLSADRYHETLRIPRPASRIDIAQVMALLSGYETMLDLDSLVLVELDAALLASPSVVPADVVFGHGVLHAFGMGSLSDALHLQLPPSHGLDESTAVMLEGQMRAVARELLQDRFEWAALSGDPRIRVIDPSMRARYDHARTTFAAEETRRSELVHDLGVVPRKAGFGAALALHVDQLLARCLANGIDPTVLPLDNDPIGFIHRIPTVHVLAELLTAQFSDSRTVWKDGDWADMRTLCEAFVYCDVVAPDGRWAQAAQQSKGLRRYDTTVLRKAPALLAFLEELA